MRLLPSRLTSSKKAGKGIFKVKTLSADLAAITGKNRMNRPDAVKAVWAYARLLLGALVGARDEAR